MFLINLIPLHVLALMATGRFSHRVYIAYTTVRRREEGEEREGEGGEGGETERRKQILSFHSLQVYCLGTMLSMQISFVGFQPVQSSEHMAVSY